MILLLDIGNTHTHLGLADATRVCRQRNAPTTAWFTAGMESALRRFVGAKRLEAIVMCSVVPNATLRARSLLKSLWHLRPLEVSARSVRGVGVEYPNPESIGADRLANAVAAKHQFGSPSVVVDFGTAVTFDVVNSNGNYVGGIIAPGLAAMTDYLHEKTALLPRIKVREPRGVIGRNTEEAMLIGAVHGYRGLIRQLIAELKIELGARNLPVIATGGYADLISAALPEITAVVPLLTLEGLRLQCALTA